jgi:hypothetical protein
MKVFLIDRHVNYKNTYRGRDKQEKNREGGCESNGFFPQMSAGFRQIFFVFMSIEYYPT